MRKYETVVVLTTTLNENELNDEIRKVQDIIEANGGSNVTVQRWGRKEIAYTAKKQKFGNYMAFYFESNESDCVDRVSRLLDIKDSVIKFQTHTVTDKRRKFKGHVRLNKAEGDESDEASVSDAEY